MSQQNFFMFKSKLFYILRQAVNIPI